MISAGDFKNGITLEIDGNVVQIIEFQHVKPGKGAAFVRTKYKNIITGAVLEKSFRPTEKFPSARIERVDMQYLYNDGELYYFMDNSTYEQIGLNQDTIGDALIRRGTAAVRGTGDHRDRTRLQGRHRPGRDKARHCGDRRGGKRAPVRGPGGQDQDRYKDGGISLQGIRAVFSRCTTPQRQAVGS